MKNKRLIITLVAIIMVLFVGVVISVNQGFPYLPVVNIGEKVVGPEQKEADVQTRGWLSKNDINLLARTVYGEARGEPYVGQVAVAAVVLNRMKNPAFPNSIPGIIFQPLAFTAVADGQIWLTPDDQSYRAVSEALNGSDPTGGAIYYFNPVTATSKWIWGRPQIGKIGKHIFTR